MQTSGSGGVTTAHGWMWNALKPCADLWIRRSYDISKGRASSTVALCRPLDPEELRRLVTGSSYHSFALCRPLDPEELRLLKLPYRLPAYTLCRPLDPEELRLWGWGTWLLGCALCRPLDPEELRLKPFFALKTKTTLCRPLDPEELRPIDIANVRTALPCADLWIRRSYDRHGGREHQRYPCADLWIRRSYDWKAVPSCQIRYLCRPLDPEGLRPIPAPVAIAPQPFTSPGSRGEPKYPRKSLFVRQISPGIRQSPNTSAPHFCHFLSLFIIAIPSSAPPNTFLTPFPTSNIFRLVGLFTLLRFSSPISPRAKPAR